MADSLSGWAGAGAGEVFTSLSNLSWLLNDTSYGDFLASEETIARKVSLIDFIFEVLDGFPLLLSEDARSVHTMTVLQVEDRVLSTESVRIVHCVRVLVHVLLFLLEDRVNELASHVAHLRLEDARGDSLIRGRVHGNVAVL